MPAPPPESDPAIVSARGRGGVTWPRRHRKWSQPRRRQRALGAVGVDRGEASAVDDPADLGERHAERLRQLRPGGVDRRVVGKRRQQLVVLAATERVIERGAAAPRARHRARPSRPTPLARARRERSIANPSETSIIAVAPCAREHASLPDARRRAQVSAHERQLELGRLRRHGRRSRRPAALPPSSPVTTMRSPDVSTRAQHRAPRRHLARHRHRDRCIPPPGQVSPDEPQGVLVAGLAHAAEQLHHPRGLDVGRERRARTPRARGLAPMAARSLTFTTIALYPRSRAPVALPHEVDALDQDVGGEDQLTAGRARATAASSPTPTRTSGPAPDSTRRIASSSSSSDEFHGSVPSIGRPARCAVWANGRPTAASLDCRASLLPARPAPTTHGNQPGGPACPRSTSTPRRRSSGHSPRTCRSARVTEFGNVNVQTRVTSRSAGSTHVVGGPSSGKTMTREEFDGSPRCRTRTSPSRTWS